VVNDVLQFGVGTADPSLPGPSFWACYLWSWDGFRRADNVLINWYW